ncbi:unnamed protein product, partial [Mesorhabditis spiculigera]
MANGQWPTLHKFNIFCPSRTHASNAYHTWVFAKVTRDVVETKEVVDEIKIAIERAVSAGYTHRVKTTQTPLDTVTHFTAVPPRVSQAFVMKCADSKYVTIYRYDGDGMPRTVALGHPVGCNESVIVAADGAIRTARMGSLFEDSHGNQH